MTSIENIANTGKIFEIIQDGQICPVLIKQLSVKQLEEVVQVFIETLKAEYRREAIELSKCLPKEEQSAFLLKAVRENSVIKPEKITDMWDKEFAAITCLEKASDKKIEWIKILQEYPDVCIEAYLYSLGQESVDTKKN